MFWEKVNTLFDQVKTFFDTIPILLGLGFCRACLGWVLQSAKYSTDLSIASSYLVPTAAGEIVGLVLITLVIYRNCSWTTHAPVVLSISLGSLGIGIILVYLSTTLNLVGAVFLTGCFFACLGYAIMFALWIELYGLFTPKKFLPAFSFSYLINLVIWLVMREISNTTSFIVCLTCAVLTGVLLVAGYRTRQATERPTNKPNLKDFPWAIMLWIIVFTFAYRLVDSITGLGHVSFPSKFGMAIPGIITIIGLCVLSKSFNSKMFFSMAFFLMVVGLGFAFFSNVPLWIAQVLLSAGIEALRLMVLAITCQYGKLGRSSAAFFYCIYSIIFRLSPSVNYESLDDNARIIIYSAIFIIVLVIGSLLYLTKYFSGNAWFERAISPNDSVSISFANKYNLTKRETTILVLLAEGRSYEEMAEELFIAQSTVRSHVGHVFEKSGVHTRWELDQKFHEYESLLQKGSG